MKPTRSKSSLSRDFTLISAAVAALLALAALWVAYDSHRSYLEKLSGQMEAEAARADRALTLEIEQASYLLEALSRQIMHARISGVSDISQMLKSFSGVPSFRHALAWIDSRQALVATSERGVLGKPIDVSDRDYVKKSLVEPGRIHIGRPVRSGLDAASSLPVALGVSAADGTYLGTLLVDLDTGAITQSLRGALQSQDTRFAVLTRTFLPVTEDRRAENFSAVYFPPETLSLIDFVRQPSGMLNHGSLWQKRGMLTFYQLSAHYPFVLLLGTEASLRAELLAVAWPNLLQLLLIAVLLLSILWIMRQRIIRPAADLVAIAGDMARGKDYRPLRHEGAAEMSLLAGQLKKIGALIAERARIEEERQNKLFTLKQAKEAAEHSNRVKMEFMTAMSSELRNPLNTIVGFSEVMKDQLYGPFENTRYWQYARDIHDAALHLQTLIADVLALSKAEAGMPELQEKAVEVGFVVNKCLRLLSDKIAAQRVNVEVRLADHLPRLKADELRLKQIILNLLSNAVTHTVSGGDIVVEARLDTDRNGNEAFLLIFTDFTSKLPPRPASAARPPDDEEEREEAEAGRKAKELLGTPSNLTVPLTKALVAMHQGAIEIESPPGRATIITVSFPKSRIVY